MSDMERPELKPTSTKAMTGDELNAYYDVHEKYQKMMKEHIVLNAAFETGAFDGHSELVALYNRLASQYEKAHNRSESQHVFTLDSPRVLAKMIEAVSKSPSQIFPDIARDIDEQIESIKVDRLLKIIDPEKNETLGRLDSASRNELTAMSRDRTVQTTFKYELLHEATFSTQPMPGQRRHSLERRLQQWVAEGAGSRVNSRVGKSLGWATSGVGAALGSPASLIGFFGTKMTQGAVERFRDIDKKIAVSIGRCFGKSPDHMAEKIDEMRSSLSERLNSPVKTVFVSGAAAVVAVAAVNGLTQGVGLDLYVEASKGLELFFEGVKKTDAFHLAGTAYASVSDLMSPISSVFAADQSPQEAAANISLADTPLEGHEEASAIAEKREEGQSAIKNTVNGVIGAMAAMMKDKFNFNGAQSPFKASPYETYEPGVSSSPAEYDQPENGPPDIVSESLGEGGCEDYQGSAVSRSHDASISRFKPQAEKGREAEVEGAEVSTCEEENIPMSSHQTPSM